jgi:hypothetical protein
MIPKYVGLCNPRPVRAVHARTAAPSIGTHPGEIAHASTAGVRRNSDTTGMTAERNGRLY